MKLRTDDVRGGRVWIVGCEEKTRVSPSRSPLASRKHAHSPAVLSVPKGRSLSSSGSYASISPLSHGVEKLVSTQTEGEIEV